MADKLDRAAFFSSITLPEVVTDILGRVIEDHDFQNIVDWSRLRPGLTQ